MRRRRAEVVRQVAQLRRQLTRQRIPAEHRRRGIPRQRLMAGQRRDTPIAQMHCAPADIVARVMVVGRQRRQVLAVRMRRRRAEVVRQVAQLRRQLTRQRIPAEHRRRGIPRQRLRQVADVHLLASSGHRRCQVLPRQPTAATASRRTHAASRYSTIGVYASGET